MQKILLGVEEATALSGVFKAACQSRPGLCCSFSAFHCGFFFFFFALEIQHGENAIFGLAGHSISDQACPSFLLPATRLSHKLVRKTTLGGGSLGSCVDEERSQLRELM